MFVEKRNLSADEAGDAAAAYVDQMMRGPQRQEHAPYGTSQYNTERLDNTSRHLGVDASELIKLAAVDTELFCKTFFPRAFRQPSPKFARSLWDVLESDARFVNAQIFRGGSKTTRCRALTLKLACYGLAHTILYIGKSEGHAVRSVAWLKRHVEFNAPLAQTYGLRRGSKWTDVECEIVHGIDDYPIWIMGMGITGSIRGINRDDFRPDLIVLDDIHDEENSATPEQREKIEELVYGAIANSLAPASEAPHAKLINLATPMNREDVTVKAMKDAGWRNVYIPCWTDETYELPTHLQESVWPERWSSEELRKEKELAGQRNRLSTWLREYELRLVSPETSAFRTEWLTERYDILPEGMPTFMAIDPVPPPSDNTVSKGLHKNDFEALAVVGIWKGTYFLLELSCNRGHDPSWTRAEFFRLAAKYRPRRIFVESTAYQRTLIFILREEMRRRGQYFPIEEFNDRRKKFDRIVDALNGVASNYQLLLPRNASERGEAWRMFLEQFEQFPSVSHDDCLEAVAVAVSAASGRFDLPDDGEADMDLEIEREQYPRLVYSNTAP